MFVGINNKNFKVKVCNSKREISEGMMGKEFTGFDGMLFFMGNGHHSFWMKNCIIPLDIIFIDSDLIITDIHHSCKPCANSTCDNYDGYGKYVLEIEGGRCQNDDIQVGDSVSFIFQNY